MDRSHRPKSPHPTAHTEEEITWIQNFIRRNPTISLIELYAKLKFQKGYRRHSCSLFRFLRKQGFYQQKASKKKPYIPKPYDTPKALGVKWQLDVKYVPNACYVGKMPDRFFQYTVIDEASRERFIYPFRETDRVHPFDLYCQEKGIAHKLIRPRTPRHNGKVERSQRNEQIQPTTYADATMANAYGKKSPITGGLARQ